MFAYLMVYWMEFCWLTFGMRNLLWNRFEYFSIGNGLWNWLLAYGIWFVELVLAWNLEMDWIKLCKYRNFRFCNNLWNWTLHWNLNVIYWFQIGNVAIENYEWKCEWLVYEIVIKFNLWCNLEFAKECDDNENKVGHLKCEVGKFNNHDL